VEFEAAWLSGLPANALTSVRRECGWRIGGGPEFANGLVQGLLDTLGGADADPDRELFEFA
jgi:hypothetical protein